MAEVDWGQVAWLAVAFTGGFASAFAIRLNLTLRDIAGFWEWREKRSKERKYRKEQAKLQERCTHEFRNENVWPITCQKCHLELHEYEREQRMKEAGLR